MQCELKGEKAQRLRQSWLIDELLMNYLYYEVVVGELLLRLNHARFYRL